MLPREPSPLSPQRRSRPRTSASGALAGAGFDVISAGIHDLKGVGPRELYAVRNA